MRKEKYARPSRVNELDQHKRGPQDDDGRVVRLFSIVNTRGVRISYPFYIIE